MAEAIAHPAIRALFPLDGRYHAGLGIALSPAPARALVALHLSDAAVSTVGQALGLELPARPKTAASAGSMTVLWLGPGDQLVVSGDGDDAAEWVERIEASGTAEQSAVDVSDRFAGIVVDGVAAAAVLNSGCPQDLRLSAFPVAAVSRTVLARAEIILWRRAENRFELFCGRSFADYVWSYLLEAARAPVA